MKSSIVILFLSFSIIACTQKAKASSITPTQEGQEITIDRDLSVCSQFGLPTNLLNNYKKGWKITLSTKDMPEGVIAVYQTRWEKVKEGKENKLKKIDEDHFIYNTATGASWRIRPGDSLNSPYDAEIAFDHTFRKTGQYIVCYAKKLQKEYVNLPQERIVAVIGTDMEPILPYNVAYMNETKVIADRYLPYQYYDVKASKKIKGTYDLHTGNKICDDCFNEIGEGVILVPKGRNRYQFCNVMLDHFLPFDVSYASWNDKMGLYKAHVSAMELLRDKNGEYHYMAEHASEPMRASLLPDSVKNYTEIYITTDGVVYGSNVDAFALRNRIADYVAPTPRRRPLSTISLKLKDRADNDDPEANYDIYLLTSITSYLDRAVELGYTRALSHKGYLLLASADSVQGQDMLRQAAKEGDKGVLALEALEMSKVGRHAEAYQLFMALGDYKDACHEAGMSALAMAYEQYEKGGERSGYSEWVERAANCGLPLAEKWAATMAKENGNSQRCAELYASAADHNDLEAAYAAGMEFDALGNYPSFEKYMEIAAKAKVADADAILGNYYLQGRPGVKADNVKAYRWLNQAHLRGDESMTPILKKISLPLASDALGDRNYASAASYARKYITIDSLNPEAFELLGLASYGAGNYAVAADAFHRQLKLQPKNAECIDNIARATSKYNAEQEAIQHKANLDGYYAAAEKALSDGKYQEIIENCESALAIDYSLSWPYAFIGVAYYFMDDYDTGMGYCQKSLDIDPSNEVAKSYLEHCQSMIQLRYNVQTAAQQQADKWQSIANLCSSSQQLFNAISNVTNKSHRPESSIHHSTTATTAAQRPSATSSSSTAKSSSSRKPSYTAADVQHRKSNQYVYDQYCSRIISMKNKTYPYSQGFTLKELKDCQDAMRSIRTEWNAKHPALPIMGSDLESWSGK